MPYTNQKNCIKRIRHGATVGNLPQECLNPRAPVTASISMTTNLIAERLYRL
ncbi:hypothetical protein HMPREF9554_00473 [Treponema phagedenis F0421]|nr:hypothetical protein HMPREF9554_00473 [Treponema phagedenis F0421]